MGAPTTDQGNTGHGYVFPRPDGVRARCGGPAMCPVCARDLARKNIEEASPSGASGNHIADAGKMVASGAGTKPWCPNCEDRDPHCMACAGEGHKRKSSGEPSGSAEIRFVMGGNVYGRPTATDALDYADDRLQDPEEMQCCLTDARVKHMNAVRELLAGVTPEPGGQPPKFYRLQDVYDRFHFVDYDARMWELIVVPQPLTKGEQHV